MFKDGKTNEKKLIFQDDSFKNKQKADKAAAKEMAAGLKGGKPLGTGENHILELIVM